MAKATAKTTEVAPSNTNANAISADYLLEMEMDSGKGVKGMSMDDVAVPYLYVVQKGTPQADEDNEKYIEGCKPGMFINNVTEAIFDGREQGIIVIPCFYERKYVEWRDRDSGQGGYVQDHDIDSGILSKTRPNGKGQPTLDNGNLIIETAYHYVYMQVTENGQTRWEEIIIPMKSTMLKNSRRWNKNLMATLIPGTAKQAPRWLYPYKLKSVKQQKGDQTWYIFDIERMAEPVTMEQYRSAKGFATAIEEGSIKRATETAVGTDGVENDRPAGGNNGAGSGGRTRPDTGDMDDDIPF